MAEPQDLSSVLMVGGTLHLWGRKVLNHKVQEWGEDWRPLPLPALTPCNGRA